jgi:hypothetical protein
MTTPPWSGSLRPLPSASLSKIAHSGDEFKTGHCYFQNRPLGVKTPKKKLAMLDHVFLSVSDIERSIAFYAQALAPLGITDRVDFDGKDGPPGYPDLKGFRRCTSAQEQRCPQRY